VILLATVVFSTVLSRKIETKSGAINVLFLLISYWQLKTDVQLRVLKTSSYWLITHNAGFVYQIVTLVLLKVCAKTVNKDTSKQSMEMLALKLVMA
jgi:hypothetical protein